MPIQRLALLSLHASPIAPMGGAKTGGMNVYVRELAVELGRQGIVVDIFTRRADKLSPAVDYRIGENVRLFQIDAGPPQPLSPEDQAQYLPAFTNQLMARFAIEARNYDMIYSHYWLSGWVAMQLKRRCGYKFVHMFHTLGQMKQRIQPADIDASDPRIAAEMQIVAAADKLVAATPAEQAQLRWLYRARRKQIVIIPPGVNTSQFRNATSKAAARASLGLAKGCHMLLFVGRIEPLKAVDTILEALRVLRDQAPERLRQLRFVIVGGDPASQSDAEMQRLQVMSRELGIEDVVRFVGAKEQVELPRYYAAATAVIMPSDYESFGMVALEAMSSGAPVIASQVGGLQFLVRDRETGYHIPAREPMSLAACIIELLSDPSRGESMGLSASRVAKDYAWSRIARRLLRLFEEVANS